MCNLQCIPARHAVPIICTKVRHPGKVCLFAQSCLITYLSYISRTPHLKESPPDEDYHEQSQSTNWSILLEHQLPVDPYGCLSVLFAVLPQSAAHFAHSLQAISSVQQIFNILRHNLRNISQLVVQLIQILRSARI